MRQLYPEIEPYQHGHLKVSPVHEIYFEQCGSPDGQPVLFVHGGPGGQSRTGYSASIQHLVNHGYAVFAANNRGSSGYGKTFYHLDDCRHGDVDLKDIVAAHAYLAGLDWIDGERIGETPIGNVTLPIGPHEIVFRHPDLGEKRHAVTVTMLSAARVSVDLRKR